ncbi:MAG: DNA mismatch repair protein MutS [Rickettsiaceae bacterium H1]|nr:DNA mismatch repair protein MutS [Rickettsiaceae bacterium H1]
MEQYLNIKEEYEDCLLFYRMGDFYELFFEDAVKASQVLNIVLTQRGKYENKSIPMCGVPAHSHAAYLHKLIENGFKVAICEQLETPAQAKKRGYKSVINREVVRIITPGTIVEDELLENNSANYILAIVSVKKTVGLSWLDLSTGNFFYCSSYNLNSDIARIEPKEILVAESFFDQHKELPKLVNEYKIFVTKYVDSFFDYKKAEKKLCDFYKISFMSNMGELSQAELSACGAVLEYIGQTQKESLLKLGYPKLYDHGHFLYIDAATRKSLEITSTQKGDVSGSLISAIDYTVTGSGGRMLKNYLSAPITDVNLINKRLDLVELYLTEVDLRQEIRNILKKYPDVERSLSRISTGKATPKDLYGIKYGLQIATDLSYVLFKSKNIKYKDLESHDELVETLDSALKDDYGNLLKNGGYINPDFNPKLAELEYTKNNSTNLLENLQELYREKIGVNNLKISSNNLVGYYIEVPARYQITNKDFIHKQSLVGSVRYTTAALQELENKIITANANSIALECEIFDDLCKTVLDKFTEITLAAQTVAKLDVIISLAELAAINNYTKPKIDDSNRFIIHNGRHPVVEKNTDDFVANSMELNDEHKLCLLTGPNMAGKSTFLRQNALIAILSQIGSFVPADSAHIGVVDKIFSRVGAADNIFKGQSTFMVEMIETAAIVNQATEKSLVILDEVGRGTALYDGLAIAWAVIENVHNINKCRAIFATHYHELCQLEDSLPMLDCYSMKVREWNREIIFLHEVIKGRSDKSYGIHVAKLAGLPQNVIARAESILESFKC